jgi:hypothetical protein
MINKIANESFVHPARKHQKLKWKSTACLVLLFLIFIILAGYDWVSKEPKIEFKKSHGEIKPTIREIQMAEYFRRKGSPVPQKMAQAVLATSKPRLMASIAVRESGGDPKAVGDGGKSKGAFQVQKHWGIVSKNVVEQALQSERVIDELIIASGGNLKVALNKYGGDRTRKVYAKNILQEMNKIPCQ